MVFGLLHDGSTLIRKLTISGACFGLLVIGSWLFVNWYAPPPEKRIYVVERYPNEWSAKPKKGKFLRLSSNTVLTTRVNKRQRLTLNAENDNKKIPFLGPRMFITMSAKIAVEKPKYWILTDINNEYQTYWVEQFGDIYNGEIRGPDESLFLRFPKVGHYEFQFVLQGTTPQRLARISDTFSVEVHN